MVDRAGCVLVALALLAGLWGATSMVTRTMVRIRADETIHVSGSARRRVAAEALIWTTHLTVRADELADGYRRLEGAATRTTSYLEGHGVARANVSVSPVKVAEIFARTPDGRHQTDRVIAYSLGQTVAARSTEMEKLRRLSLAASELIAAAGLAESGVVLTSDPPRYIYGALEDIKHEVLAEASANARKRAREIAAATGTRLGRLRSVHLVDVQILSDGSADRYSDDVSSPEKYVVVDVDARFDID
jgi:hypothetical protein